MTNVAYIALGSNIGDRESYLHQGIEALRTTEEVSSEIIHSSIYETKPVGVTEQASFLNMVIKINTTKEAADLLSVTQNIEEKADRVREKRWGPRTLDLDILLYNQENMEREDLCIPHPRMTERAFVLVPLAEMAPHMIIPSVQLTVMECLQQLPDAEREGVVKWKSQSGPDEFERSES
ncbi:2-amino-4-hydroxy-6-hydroxymethyldihydropteridine diphosphokinase [Salsuginibacillus kocurii]|uniref:2-amino-4-hydroxy-6- hydroxymethyldihydropteridine diphosphokinase n=1 Tax=Salsuginibacillus kocurii TaxID=427078 RepID=UPI0003774075|nr:2-amino-4-hydroxy-6-hydroxymethyldihydropteridine diphosphokinase [Salsuginibacillus kocurii]